MYLNTSKSASPPKTTSETLLLSQIDTGNILANHKRHLEVIRDTIWPRVTSVSHLPPSVTALQRHVWRPILYLRQISNSHATPLDAEGTLLCEKCGYVNADGKAAFDWEDREVARRNEKEKEILLVKCSCQKKKKCSERSNYKCRKSGICCGPLCSCLDCGDVVLEAQGLNELRKEELSS